MSFLFRRSKKKGGFNFTVSNSGLGVSYGKGPVRISRGATGRTQTNISTPITGLRYNMQHGKNASIQKIATDYSNALADKQASSKNRLQEIRERQRRLQGRSGIDPR